MACLSRALLLCAFILLPLVACSSGAAEDQVTSTPTPASEDAGQLDGETTEIDGQVRLTVPAGWDVQTGDLPGLGVYVATVVPEGTADDALQSGQPRVDFAYLVLLNIGPTRGAQGYAEAQIETDRANTEYYADIEEQDPVVLGDETFYGYRGLLITDDRVGPIQYWYGDVHEDTYKFELFGERAGDAEIPQDLVDVMRNAEFIE